MVIFVLSVAAYLLLAWSGEASTEAGIAVAPSHGRPREGLEPGQVLTLAGLNPLAGSSSSCSASLPLG